MTPRDHPLTITVFGSGVCAPGDPEFAAAEELGRLLGGAGFALCCGGYGGAMEAAARGARAAGGHTIGITHAADPRPANTFILEEIRAADLLERLRQLLGRADGFVVLPGGTGTLAELALALEFNRKGFAGAPPRPVVLLGEFWRPAVENAGGGPADAPVAASPAEAVAILRRALRD